VSAFTPTVMSAAGLHKRFGGQIILNETAFEMRQGEVVLLRGANGAGKTTLLNILTGNLEPDAGAISLYTTGREECFQFPRSWARNLNFMDHFTPERIAREGVSRSWQDIRLFPTHTLRDNVALAIQNQTGESPFAVFYKRGQIRAEEAKIAKDADALLAQFGLGGRELSSADMVSLGQSKRVAIARSVLAGAKILFLDEPLAALDSRGIDDVMGLLRRVVDEHKVTVVVVEHVFNIPRVLDMATTVWTIANGRIQIETPAAVGAQGLPTESDGVRPWLRQLAGSGGQVVERQLPGGALLSHVALKPGAAEPALDVKDLVVRRGRRPVIGTPSADGQEVAGLSFALPQGSIGVLQAPNGWGKTTFLEALSGVIPIARGSIAIDGKAVHDRPTWDRIGRGLGILQSRDNVFPNLLVDEAIKLAGVPEVPEHIKPFLGRRVAALSGGERQNVAAVCALYARPNAVNVLDEPFGMLDAKAIGRLQSEIVARNSGATLMLLPAASN